MYREEEHDFSWSEGIFETINKPTHTSTLHSSNYISSAIISACVVRSIDWKAPCICPQKPLEKSFSNEFRLKFPQPIKNLRPLNPESTIYRTPTSVSASEASKCRPTSKYQFSKYRPCCTFVNITVAFR